MQISSLNAMLARLICPKCRVEIVQSDSGWTCPACAARYPYRQGILSFLTDADAVKFNEGEHEGEQKNAWSESAALRQKIRQSRLLSFLNTARIKFSFSGRRDRIFYNEMAGGDNLPAVDARLRWSTVTPDPGVRHYFCNYGKVIGVDPVLGLLQSARLLYDEVYHAGGYRLPFADNSFDYLVSSDVLGHIPFENKDELFAEMYRVLKPGGRTVHVIETDCTNLWFRQAKKIPGFFEKHFVDMPGHIGLELPTALKKRFIRHGFKEVVFRKISSNVFGVGSISNTFSDQLKQHPVWVRCAVRIDAVLGKSFLVREGLHFLMEPVAALDDFLTPIDYGHGMLVVFEK